MADPSCLAVIPARYDSVRFPGKPLAADTGRPLIQHVHEQVLRATTVGRIIVATDDRRIFDAVRSFGGDAVMTRRDHPNGTSRVAEAIEQLPGETDEIIVNVQGDEPEIEPSLIDLAVETLVDRPECPMSTIASPFADDEQPGDPNIVKVVCDRDGRALYFSRLPVPCDRDGTAVAPPLKHVGLYVYRREFLLRYVGLPPTPLEQTERLEQLRVLEHGHRIAVAVAVAHHHGIDTRAQYAGFVERVRRQGSAISHQPSGEEEA